MSHQHGSYLYDYVYIKSIGTKIAKLMRYVPVVYNKLQLTNKITKETVERLFKNRE